MIKNKFSALALVLGLALLCYSSIFYYPRWEQQYSEATISWDVDGYYSYLPAVFIYHDLEKIAWADSIRNKYYPSPHNAERVTVENGNAILKYSCGRAITYLPFFAIAHVIALNSDHPADGFSYPYQLWIGISSLFYAFIGLLLLRVILLRYFNDITTAIVLIIIVFGTNYLDYAGINGAMTHNMLFTLYAFLIYLTIRFYENPSYKWALGIGFTVGLSALIRPTELMSAIIPVLWGVNFPILQGLKKRIALLRENIGPMVLAVVACIAVGSIQLIYWKVISGGWIVYSYSDQGFSWLRPHLINGLFSYKAGWLVYTPIMVFALIGFIPLWKKQRPIWLAVAAFSAILIYVTFAWDIWTYGVSIGQRAMIQGYVALSFPLAATISFVNHHKWWKWLFYPIVLLFIYYNLWLTHQAHHGGLYRGGEMTQMYFWRTLGRYDVPESAQKLLDNRDEYRGEKINPQVLYILDLESDSTTADCNIEPITQNGSLCLNTNDRTWTSSKIDLPKETPDWLRATATFRIGRKEYDVWKSTQFTIKLWNKKEKVKERSIRVHRMLSEGETQRIYTEIYIPTESTITHATIDLWNAGSPHPILIDELEVECFNQE